MKHFVFCNLNSFLARGTCGFTWCWHGGSEMSLITGNKRSIGANSNLNWISHVINDRPAWSFVLSFYPRAHH